MWDLSSQTRDPTHNPYSGSYARFYVLKTCVTNKSDGAVVQFWKARFERKMLHSRHRITDISDKVGYKENVFSESLQSTSETGTQMRYTVGYFTM